MNMPRYHAFSALFAAVAAAVGATSVAYAACNIVEGKAYGDCAGVAVNRGTSPFLEVRGASSENGIVTGATVYPGGSFHLYGISTGDITVHKGARLSVSGVVNGTVRNLGGTVDIEGTSASLFTLGGVVTIGGTVGSVSGSGAVHFRRGSVLGGTPFESATLRSGKT